MTENSEELVLVDIKNCHPKELDWACAMWVEPVLNPERCKKKGHKVVYSDFRGKGGTLQVFVAEKRLSYDFSVGPHLAVEYAKHFGLELHMNNGITTAVFGGESFVGVSFGEVVARAALYACVRHRGTVGSVLVPEGLHLICEQIKNG